jgi:protein SCO1/2
VDCWKNSIFFYLMDPHGQFVDAFGKNSTVEDVTGKVMQAVERWRAAGEQL